MTQDIRDAVRFINLLLVGLLGAFISPIAQGQEAGLIVEYFEPRSAPGARAGIMPGDKLLEYDGMTLISPATLLALEEHPRSSGDEITVRLVREGQVLTLPVPRGPLGAVTSLELPDDVRELYRQSWMLLDAENTTESLAKTREAAQAMLARGDKTRAAWIWWSQGIRFGNAKKWAEAEQLYKEALALLAEVPDIAARSLTLSALGNCSFSQEKIAEAANWWRQALEVDESAGYVRWATGGLTQLAQAAQIEGNLLTARGYNQKARIIYEKIGPRSFELAGVLNNLGDNQRALGDLRSAEELFTASLRIKEALAGENPLLLLSIAGTQSNLGGVALARGDLPDAREYFQRALAVRERFLSEDSPEIAATLNNLGYVEHDGGNIPAAESYYKRALVIYRQIAPESVFYAQVLANLGNAAYDRKDFSVAEENYRQAVALLEKLVPDSLDAAKAYHNLGNIQVALLKTELAKANHARARAIYERLSPDSLDLAMVLNSTGAVELAAARYAEAQQLFTRAVEIVENHRGQIRSTEARAFLIEQRMSEFTGLLRSFLGSKDYARAFETVERARARSLAEMIFEKEHDVVSDAPGELIARQKELAEKKSDAYFRMTRLDPRRDSSAIENLRREIERFAIEQRRLNVEIRQSSPRFSTLEYPTPLDLSRARAALDVGTLLFSYFVDEDTTYLFIVSKTEIKYYPIEIGREDLSRQVSTFMMRVANPDGAIQNLGRNLYDILVRPAEAQIASAERILISPDGPLHKLAFAALEATPSGANLPEGQARYFIQLKPLHVIVSMSVYDEVRWQNVNQPQTTAQTVLAVGDPAYQALPGGLTQVIRECGERQEDVALLPVTRAQVLAIGDLYGARANIKLDLQASETTFKREASMATIIHVASHGYAEDCDPLSSFLALTPGSDREDGLLRAFEIIDGLRLRADLVVLSACQTGLGRTTRSEGIIGLTRAFQYAGARSVVVSLWKITDESTSQLMKEFYKQYKAGKSKDEALKQAQISLITSQQYAHPYYWAPFVLTGYWH